MPSLLAVLCLAVLVPAVLDGQRVRGNSTPPPATSPNMGAHKGLVVTLHGALKKITKKNMLIQSRDNQFQTIRLARSTRYFRNGKEIKPYDIDLDSLLTIDVSQDVDLKFVAIRVTADQ